MQKIVAALALSGAAAFVAPVAPAAGTALNGKEEMQALAESNPDLLGRTIGFWDPFNLIAEGDFWGLGNEATIGYLRHAEIKHGRVAMAAFLGFIVQSLPVVSGEHLFAPYRGYVAGVSPQEQWDNLPAIGKLQIAVAIGKCGTCLGDGSCKFVSHQERAFCPECYATAFGPRCAACDLPIGAEGTFVAHKGRKLHPKCFACAVCAASACRGSTRCLSAYASHKIARSFPRALACLGLARSQR